MLERQITPSLFQSTHPSGVRLHPKVFEIRLRGISIHAPQWGATFAAQFSASTFRLFQSTHPSGVRLHAVRARGQLHEISIHAPQWGATSGTGWPRRSSSDFNPRTPVGCDGLAHAASSAYAQFQSTHPSGVRRVGRADGHGGGSISIHAPQWGVTHGIIAAFTAACISIHAPQWGATTRSRISLLT